MLLNGTNIYNFLYNSIAIVKKNQRFYFSDVEVYYKAEFYLRIQKS